MKPEDESPAHRNNQGVDVIAKLHESFKKETVLNINKINTSLQAINRRLGMGNLNITNDNGKDEKEEVSKANISKDRNADGPTRKKGDEFTNVSEDKLYEVELTLKRIMHDQKKELMERFEIINNQLEDMKTR